MVITIDYTDVQNTNQTKENMDTVIQHEKYSHN